MLEDIYIVRDYNGNLRMFVDNPILSPKYKTIVKTDVNFYGEEEIVKIKTNEYLYDEWICPIYPEDDSLDNRRYGFVVDDAMFASRFRELKHTDSPVLISKKDGKEGI